MAHIPGNTPLVSHVYHQAKLVRAAHISGNAAVRHHLVSQAFSHDFAVVAHVEG